MILWDATIIDKKAKEALGMGRLLANTPQEAGTKAAEVFKALGLVKEDGDYFIHVLPMGPVQLPDEAQINIPTTSQILKIAKR